MTGEQRRRLAAAIDAAMAARFREQKTEERLDEARAEWLAARNRNAAAALALDDILNDIRTMHARSA